MCRCYDANEIAMRMKRMLMSGILHESGWALLGNFAYINCCLIILLDKMVILENWDVVQLN